MDPIEVKICGLTNIADADMALDAGADYIGFVLYPRSPRGITPAKLAKIVGKLSGRGKPVGVFVNRSRREVEKIAGDCGLYAIQLSGDESALEFEGIQRRLWRAVRIRGGKAEPAPEEWPADRYVVDAAVAERYGGTGVQADMKGAALLARVRDIMLAGGLTPDNVADAIRRVRPAGVDVASGVESRPGKKDPEKVRAFILRAKACRDPGQSKAGQSGTHRRER